MADSPKLLPIRFWWGFKRDDVTREAFLKALGDIFFPQTVDVMHRQLGALSGYLPVVPPAHGCLDVPDEMALVVYKSIPEYEAAMATLQGRSYQLLHDAIFRKPSSSNGFPILLEDEFESGQPYFVWSRANDWMNGHCNFIIGRRPQGVKVEQFHANLQAAAASMKRLSSDINSPDTVLIRATKNVATYCELWCGDGIPNGNCSGQFRAVANAIVAQTAITVRLPSYTTKTGGLRVSDGGEFFNLQF